MQTCGCVDKEILHSHIRIFTHPHIIAYDIYYRYHRPGPDLRLY